jgi:hypothetical protein
MVLFLFALAVAVLGVAAYAHYNPGVLDITVRNYHFSGVPAWWPVALAAGVPLFLFLLHALYASVRIRMLRRASQQRPSEPSRSLSPQPGPKRSWTTEK